MLASQLLAGTQLALDLLPDIGPSAGIGPTRAQLTHAQLPRRSVHMSIAGIGPAGIGPASIRPSAVIGPKPVPLLALDLRSTGISPYESCWHRTCFCLMASDPLLALDPLLASGSCMPACWHPTCLLASGLACWHRTLLAGIARACWHRVSEISVVALVLCSHSGGL